MFSAHFVYDGKCNHSCEHIHNANKHGGEEGILKAGIGKNLGAVVENGVDSHELAKDGNGRADEDGLQDAGLTESLPFLGFVFTLAANLEPARAFRNEEDEHQEQKVRDGLAAKHASPVLLVEHPCTKLRVCGIQHGALQDDEVHKVRKQEAYGYEKLIKAYHGAADFGGGHLRNIHR